MDRNNDRMEISSPSSWPHWTSFSSQQSTGVNYDAIGFFISSAATRLLPQISGSSASEEEDVLRGSHVTSGLDLAPEQATARR